MTEVPFPQLLHRFFHQWLVEQRNASHHTVISYRDTWRLFLRHASAVGNKPVDRLRLSELHLKSDDPEGKAEAMAQILDCERIGADVEIGETLVRFTPGGPQGRPELQAEMFV